MKALVINRPDDPEFEATIAELKKARARITLISEEQAKEYNLHGRIREDSNSSLSEQRS
jgi:hypothetical protein